MRDTDPHTVTRTSWWRVWALILCGIFSAFQIGKVPAGLPAISSELGLGLVGAGWVVSIFTLISGIFGMAVGVLAGRLGALRAVIAGLVISGLASAGGALAETPFVLLVSRMIEGFGFILTVIAATPLVVASCSPRDRDKALGLWAAYMPAGMALMVLLSPMFITAVGWRGLWLANSAFIIGWAVVIGILMGGDRAKSHTPPGGAWPSFADIAVLLRTPGTLLIGAIFGIYAGQYISVTAFLPLMMIDLYGVSLSSAATLTAIVIFVNVFGNVASGWMLSHGWSRRGLLIISAAGIGISALGIYAAWLPFEARYTAALAFSLIAGLTPGTLFSAVPVIAPKPALVAGLTGLMLQGVAIGQLFGPPSFAAAVDKLGGWDYAGWFIAISAVVNVVLAIQYARLRRRQNQAQ